MRAISDTRSIMPVGLIILPPNGWSVAVWRNISFNSVCQFGREQNIVFPCKAHAKTPARYGVAAESPDIFLYAYPVVIGVVLQFVGMPITSDVYSIRRSPWTGMLYEDGIKSCLAMENDSG